MYVFANCNRQAILFLRLSIGDACFTDIDTSLILMLRAINRLQMQMTHQESTLPFSCSFMHELMITFNTPVQETVAN